MPMARLTYHCLERLLAHWMRQVYPLIVKTDAKKYPKGAGLWGRSNRVLPTELAPRQNLAGIPGESRYSPEIPGNPL